MLPPRQTPHSTNAPGIPARITYSTALASAAIRSGGVCVYGLTRSTSAWSPGSKSAYSGASLVRMT